LICIDPSAVERGLDLSTYLMYRRRLLTFTES
jgi:hypothetical protein